MKPKNIFKGISKLFLGGLLAYSLNTSDLKAQSQGDPVVKSVNYKVTLVKEDGSLFRESTPTSMGEAGVNIFGWPGKIRPEFGDTLWEDVYYDFGAGDPVSGGVDSSGFIEFDFDIYTPNMVTSVRDEQPLAPKGYRLSSNYPEPFIDETKVEVINKEREVADLVVYDILGQEVIRKSGVVLPVGKNIVSIDGFGNLANGVYIFTAEGKNFAMAEKLMKNDGAKNISPLSRGSLSKSYDVSGVDIKYIGTLPTEEKSYATVRVNGGSEKLLKTDNGVYAFTKLSVNAAVPGFGSWDGSYDNNLWVKDSLTGEYAFQDSLEDTILLEGYPSGGNNNSSAP